METQRDIYSGAQLIQLGKKGLITESFTSKNGEDFTKVDGKLCYISKAARASFAQCEVSKLKVVEVTNDEGSFYRLQCEGLELSPKTGNWH